MSPASARDVRLAQLLDLIRSDPRGKWSAGRVHAIRLTAGGPVQRGTARRDLIELARRGHLSKCGPADGRYFILKHRKDGA